VLHTETLFCKAILKFLAGGKFVGFLLFRECWKNYKKFEEKLNDKNYYDLDTVCRIKFGLGLFNIIFASFPKALSALIRIIGFQPGNKEKGLEYLESCINSAAKSRSALAAIVLCLYHIDLNPNLEKVCEILKKYMRLYPKNALFQWIASNVSWKYSQLDDAVFFIKNSLKSCPESF